MTGLTILRSRDPATKRFLLGNNGQIEKRSFGAGKYFRAEELAVGSLFDLITVLRRLERDTNASIIRGAPRPGVALSRVRRTKNPDSATGEPAYFEDTPRSWVMLDLDKIPAPACCDPAFDPDDAIEHLIGLLPEPFHDATCWWQWSSSQSVPKHRGDLAPDTLSAHLWFWLDRPIPDLELKAYMAQAAPLVDRALFNAVQLHYTAAPVFIGLPDPLPRRSGLRRGLTDLVTLPTIAPKPERPIPSGQEFREGGIGFKGWLARIGDHDGGSGFHEPLLRASACYIATHGRSTDREALKEVLRQTIAAAPKRAGRAADIARYTSDAYLDPLLDGAFAKFGDRKPRLISGVPPAYPARDELDGEAAAARLQQEVSKFLDQAQNFVEAREELHRRLAASRKESDRQKQAAYDERLGADAASWWAQLPPEVTGPIDRAANTEYRNSAKRVAAEIKTQFGLKDLNHAPRIQIRAPAGLGKTRAIISELGQRPFWQNHHVHIYVPTIALAEELATPIHRERLQVRVIRGREYAGEQMCKKPKAARLAAQLGLEVYKALCRRSGTDARGDKITHQCPFFAGCSYIAQWSEPSPGIYIFAHTYLYLPKRFGLPAADLVIVDENIAKVMVGHTEFGVDRLEGPVADAVRDHLDRNIPLHEALLAAGVTSDVARQWAKDLEDGIQHAEAVRPDMTEEGALEAMKMIERTEQHKKVKLLRRIAEELPLERPLHGVELRPDAHVLIDGKAERQDRIAVHWPRETVVKISTPVLLIDADAELVINRRIFGLWLEETFIAARRRAHVVACYSTLLSKRTLLGDNETGERARAKVTQIVQAEMAGGSQVLVVASKRAREKLSGEAAKARSTDWQGATLTHFGAIRGCDEWKDYDTVVIVGREQPSPQAVERMARALFADDPEPLLFGGYVEVPRGYRMADGSEWGVTTYVHPDLRCQLLLELIREREFAQAIDRLRLVHAVKPKRVVLLCNLPLDITVDELRTLDQLAGISNRLGPARFDVAVQRAGMLPLGARDLHRAFRDLWPSPAVAKDALAALTCNRILFGAPSGFSEAEYRRKGQRGKWSRVAFDPDRIRDPKEKLQDLLGEAIDQFRITLERPAPIERPGRPEGEGSQSTVLAPILVDSAVDIGPASLDLGSECPNGTLRQLDERNVN